jgi:hypothetical protein
MAMVERAWPGLTKSLGRSRAAVAAKAVDAAGGRIARAALDLFRDNSNLNPPTCAGFADGTAARCFST